MEGTVRGYGESSWLVSVEMFLMNRALREQVENDELELDGPVQMKLVHSSRHGLDMATRLLSGMSGTWCDMRPTS